MCFLTCSPLADPQGISWDGPTDDSGSVAEAPREEEPLYAVPRKDHHAKFTVEDFVLHKLLGKGSFGKVPESIRFPGEERELLLWDFNEQQANKLSTSIFLKFSLCSRCFWPS